MSLLPIFLKLEGRRCLLVGAGPSRWTRSASLLRPGCGCAWLRRKRCGEVRQLAREGRLEWMQRAFEARRSGWKLCGDRGDDSRRGECGGLSRGGGARHPVQQRGRHSELRFLFWLGGAARRAADRHLDRGESPAVAQRLRREIDEQLPDDLGPWLDALGQLRREVLATHPRGEERRLLLHELAQRQICDSALCATKHLARTGKKARAAAGQVYLVGAGPGDPELLTVKAVRLIEIGGRDSARRSGSAGDSRSGVQPRPRLMNVGKRCGVKTITQEEINALMIEHARAGRSVVRLKSGDPLLFGRAAEEMAALREAGVAFEVVPGVSAAFAAAAAIGCSLTDRDWASNVIFSTGHHAQSHNRSPLPALEDATRVVYMPGRDLRCWRRSGSQRGCRRICRARSFPVRHSRMKRCGTRRWARWARRIRRLRRACCLRVGQWGT